METKEHERGVDGMYGRIRRMSRLCGWVLVMVLLCGTQAALAKDAAPQTTNDVYAQMIKAATEQAVKQARSEKFEASKAIKFIQSA